MIEEKEEALSLMIDAIDLMKLCRHSNATSHLEAAIQCLSVELGEKSKPAQDYIQAVMPRIGSR